MPSGGKAVIRSLHHLTATVDQAQPDLDFYAGLLGLRLVKRTVNFDNHGVYHFYYGDERGTPGTLMTTFPYHGKGVAAGTKGAGQITATAFSVPVGSLGRWSSRLAGAGVAVAEQGVRFGHPWLGVDDPSGLRIELLEAEDGRAPWTGSRVPAEAAVRGLHSATLSIAAPGLSLKLLAGPLGWRVEGEEDGRTRVAIGAGGAGNSLDILAVPGVRPGRNGLGTVHHVAMAIGTAEEQLTIREELLRLGLRVTDVLDRQYFTSIYFREPGGVLFEIATLQPGFSVDEDLGSLGHGLKLPPWEEPHRSVIEAALPAIQVP